MTAIETDDLVVVTGPLKLVGLTEEESCVALKPGEVGRVLEAHDGPRGFGRSVRVLGYESDLAQWIDAESLTPLGEALNSVLDASYNREELGQNGWASPEDLDAFLDDTASWGDLIDLDFSAIHDYVYEGDDE